MLSFKLVRNLGLGSLCVVILGISILSFLSQQRTTNVLKDIVNTEEIKLNKWIELLSLVSDVAGEFYINERKSPEALDPIVVLVQRMDNKIGELAGYYYQKDFRIKQIKIAIRKFKSGMVAYRQELKEGYGGSSAREFEKLVLLQTSEINHVARKLAEEEGKLLALKDKNLIIQIDLTNNILVLVLIGSLLLVLFVAVYLGKALTEPVEIISYAMEQVAKGDLSYRVNYLSQDIVGRLMRAFNHMADDLEVLQDTLKRKNDSLSEINEELHVTQAKLVQTEKMAAIGQLAGGVAHEINNPLTGVLNNVQLVKMIAQEKQEFSINEFKEYLDVIEESALRCKKITESLLDFSHASVKHKQAVSINELVEKVTLLIGHEMKLQNIDIRKDLSPEIPMTMGDSQLLQQVVFNIISNAKYAIDKKSGRAGGIIQVSTQCHTGDTRVCMCITDNGTGIPKGIIKKIFDPFFTTKPVGEGTGLGLSFVYSVVKEHNGTITVESKENEGTTFKICLPVFKEE
jgi:signal transduction histidine kinase